MAPFLILIAKPFLGPWDVSAIYWMECSEIDIARSARARRTRPSLSEIGRDRCGLGPFPTWSLFKRYGLRERDLKVTTESVGGRSGDGAIGPYFQLLLDAEDEAARVFGERGTVEGCRLIRNEVAKHVKIDD